MPNMFEMFDQGGGVNAAAGNKLSLYTLKTNLKYVKEHASSGQGGRWLSVLFGSIDFSYNVSMPRY